MPCEDKLDPVIVAKTAGLRYVSDASPGIRRKRAGKNFSYIGLDGKPIHDQEELKRIRSLGIPPAWTNVWICPRPNGHIQATGRDAKGRKQYRYHPRWREVRDETKYSRMIAFGETLPKIRERVAKDLALPGLPHEKVLAAGDFWTGLHSQRLPNLVGHCFCRRGTARAGGVRDANAGQEKRGPGH